MRALPLLLLLAGCSSAPRIVEVPVTVEVVRYETIPVPAVLLQPCTLPSLDIKTNQDLESSLGAAILELQRCTEDKVAISELE